MSLSSIILALCGVILLALCVLFIRACLVVITVYGQSMSPALEQGDRVLALRFFLRDWIRKGQIVLVWSAYEARMPRIGSGLSHIKRVVALEGETFTSSAEKLTWQVPRRSLFVCGDNRAQSIDSRTWGALPLKNVLGLVLLKLPLKSTRSVPQLHTMLSQGLPAGQTAPAFTAQALNGETVTLRHYQGQNVLFLFITVTELIRKRMPSYLALATGAAAQQISFVLVSSADGSMTRAFVEELQIILPVLVAPFDENPFFRDYHIPSIPCYCFVNAEGRVQSSGRANDSFPAWKCFVETCTPPSQSAEYGVE